MRGVAPRLLQHEPNFARSPFWQAGKRPTSLAGGVRGLPTALYTQALERQGKTQHAFVRTLTVLAAREPHGAFRIAEILEFPRVFTVAFPVLFRTAGNPLSRL